jgi:hypothetical protein
VKVCRCDGMRCGGNRGKEGGLRGERRFRQECAFRVPARDSLMGEIHAATSFLGSDGSPELLHEKEGERSQSPEKRATREMGSRFIKSV